jgi:hypothetical protein
MISSCGSKSGVSRIRSPRYSRNWSNRLTISETVYRGKIRPFGKTEKSLGDGARKMFRSFEFALDEHLVDNDVGGESVGSLLCQAFTHFRMGSMFRCIRFDTDRDAVDERERLRVLGEHRRKRT